MCNIDKHHYHYRFHILTKNKYFSDPYYYSSKIKKKKLFNSVDIDLNESE